MALEIHHDLQQLRFTTAVDGITAELIYEKDDELKILAFTHTFVPKALEGQGIGRALILESLNYMRQEGYRMKPVCPFVIAYAKKNIKDLKDLLPEDFER